MARKKPITFWMKAFIMPNKSPIKNYLFVWMRVTTVLTICEYFINIQIQTISSRSTYEEHRKNAGFHLAETNGIACEQRDGKIETIGAIEFAGKGFDSKLRQVFRVIKRTIDRHGQILLLPEIEVHVYGTSLRCSPARVIELYRDHGTSEQFHREIKTDLDLERLPSGKFVTNDLVLHAGIFAYNLLRMMGQESIREEDSPIRRKVQRRRIKTVIQNLIYRAARFVRHAGQFSLNFGRSSPWFRTARRLSLSLA
jgi:hypothetical protein